MITNETAPSWYTQLPFKGIY